MNRFRGGYPASMDAKGRLKLPTRLRDQLEEWHGRDLFVCSFFPWDLRLFPLDVWEGYEARLDALDPFDPVAMKVIELLNYGQQAELDDQGRILVPQLLRETVDVGGEVVVSGRINHLAVTRRQRAAELLESQSLSNQELETLTRAER